MLQDKGRQAARLGRTTGLRKQGHSVSLFLSRAGPALSRPLSLLLHSVIYSWSIMSFHCSRSRGQLRLPDISDFQIPRRQTLMSSF